MPKVRIICKQCNKTFETTQTEINRGQKYCSRNCYYSASKGKIITEECKKKISEKNKVSCQKSKIIIFCKTCGKRMELTLYWSKKRKYCSNSCHNRNRKFSEETKQKISNSRKNKLVGKNNPKWKGGKFITRNHIKVLYKNHPFAGQNGYIWEHRLVMEKHLGRYLDSKEVVHHINCNPLDNRIENLMLLKNCGYHAQIHRKLNKLNKQ